MLKRIRLSILFILLFALVSYFAVPSVQARVDEYVYNLLAKGNLTVQGNTTLNGAVGLGDNIADIVTVTGKIAGATPLSFDGTTANAIYTIFAITDPTSASKTVTFADASGTVMLSTLATNAPDVANSVTGGTNQLIFEGSTADGVETIITATNPTADRTVTLADASGTVMLSSLATNAPDAANSVTGGTNQLILEGATADDFETFITPTDATADRTITIPDRSGTLAYIVRPVTNDTDGKTLTVAESGTVQTNAGAVGAGIWNLPEASTAIGVEYVFAVSAAQNMDINPDNADQILGLTNAVGDAIRSATAGNTVTLVAIDSTNWVVQGSYGTWADVN